MAVTYLRLFDPTQQFQLKNGAINVAGLLKVKLEGTDDWAPVFDEDGTQLQQPVILDNNGRSKGLFVDASKVYWLEVDDRDGYELFTIRKMVPCGGGSGSSLGATYDVQSSDGTVDVTRYDNGGTVTFDLSIATVNEAAKWGATFGTASSISAGDIWEQVPAWTSAGSVAWNNGWEATKDCVADIAASLEMTSGDAGAISTFDVRCDFSVDGTVVSTEYGMLDPSDNAGRVTFEYKGALTEGQKIDCRFSVKSVEAMNVALAARAYYNEECDGVVGGDNQGTTYIPGDYVEITTADVINVTGLQPVSGMSSYATQSALDSCCSSMSSVVSSIQNDVSSISSVVSGITGLTGDFVEKSSISAESAQWNEVSSKVDQSAFDSCCSSMSGYISALQGDVSSLSSTVSGLTGQYVEISSISGYSSIWNSASAVPGKLDESAFTAYTATATAGDFTGVRTDSSLTGNGMPGSALGVNGMELVFDSSMETSISGNSAIVGVGTAITSGFIPTSESANYVLTSQSGAFQPSGNYVSSSDMSGYVDASSISAASSVWNSASAISSLMPWSSLEGDGTSITAISGSAIGGGGTGGKTYSGIAPVIVDNDADTISLSSRELVFSSPLSAVDSGNSAIVSIDLSAYALSSDVSGVIDTVSTNSASWGQGGVDSATVSAIASSYAESAASGKLDSSASSSFYTTANESGFITGVDLSPYQTTAGMSAYQPSGDYIYASSLGTGNI